MGSLICADSRSLRLEQHDSLRGVEIVRALAGEARILHRTKRRAEPWLVVQADPYEQRSGFELSKLARFDLQSVGVLKRRGQALYLNPLPTDNFNQAPEVSRGGDYRKRLGAPGGSSPREEKCKRVEQHPLLLFGKNRLGNHAVDPFAYVHHLRHAAVRHHRSQGVGFVSVHGHHFLARQEIHSLFDSVDHCFVQVLVEAHQDPMSFGLYFGPLELHVLSDNWLHHELTIGALQRCQIDLAVSLPTVRISNPDEPSLKEDRDKDRASLLELVEVHVGAILPGAKSRNRRHGIFSPALARRGVVGVNPYCQNARERLKINRDPGFKLGLTGLPIKIEVPDKPFRKFRCQGADGGKLLTREVEVKPKSLGSDP